MSNESLPKLTGWTFYVFPWTYHGWGHMIPVLHVWRFHVAVWRMGRSVSSGFWLPNIQVTYHK